MTNGNANGLTFHPTFPQVSQIGVSACGATAVINALLALDSPHTTATVAAQGRTADDIKVVRALKLPRIILG